MRSQGGVLRHPIKGVRRCAAEALLSKTSAACRQFPAIRNEIRDLGSGKVVPFVVEVMSSLYAMVDDPVRGDSASDRARSALTDRSFENVFESERDSMVRLAYLMLGSPEQAEEAAQDAFARLLDVWGSVVNPGGFVRTATVNRCRDLLRRRQRMNRILRMVRRDSMAEHPDGSIVDLLARVEPNRREVLVLKYYFQHTTPEIADLLGIPEGTVRSRLQRGIEDLRGMFNDD